MAMLTFEQIEETIRPELDSRVNEESKKLTQRLLEALESMKKNPYAMVSSRGTALMNLKHNVTPAHVESAIAAINRDSEKVTKALSNYVTPNALKSIAKCKITDLPHYIDKIRLKSPFAVSETIQKTLRSSVPSDVSEDLLKLLAAAVGKISDKPWESHADKATSEIAGAALNAMHRASPEYIESKQSAAARTNDGRH